METKATILTTDGGIWDSDGPDLRGVGLRRRCDRERTKCRSTRVLQTRLRYRSLDLRSEMAHAVPFRMPPRLLASFPTACTTFLVVVHSLLVLAFFVWQVTPA